MEHTVRKAEKADLPRILEIYAYARGFMAATGNPNQWGKTNPPKETLEQDIAERKLHVVEKHGFSRRGIIHIADGSPRIAYERT